MTTFDGWDARVNGVGQSGRRVGASMMSRDAPGWAMTYQGDMAHGGTFGRGHYRGDRGMKLLYGSQAYSRQLAAQVVAKPVYSEQGIVGGFEWRSPNHLNHFRTKGSKNGVRRYQNEDGSWTPLGLKERRAREGFGERLAKRREERAQRRAAAREYISEQRKKRNPKYMTDEELQKGIERKKMEQEYRELNRSPLLKTAQGLIEGYAKSKAEKAQAERQRYQMETQRIQALGNLKKSQAELQAAKNGRIDAFTGTNRLKSRAEFLKAKDQRSKNTIRGAISRAVGNILGKEGSRFVKEMGDESIVMKGGRKVKSAARKSVLAGKNAANKILDNYRYGANMNAGSGPNLN